MSGRHLRADACFAFWYDGEGEADDVDTESEECIGHACGECSVADHDGCDGVFAGEDTKSCGGHGRAEVSGVFAQLCAQLIGFADEFKSFERGGGDGWSECI